MSAKSKEKGDELEAAVRLIQNAVLSADPNLAGTRFTIEAKKMVVVSGVQHEIDIFVTTLPNSTFKATHVFECKNWRKPVGKNEVIVLAEKVKALGASNGYLVAREITKSAAAQVKLDARLAFIRCRDDFVTPLGFNLLHVVHEPSAIIVGFKERGVPPLKEPLTLDLARTVFQLKGQQIDLGRYAMRHVEAMADQDKAVHGAQYTDSSSHHRQMRVSLIFDQGECQVDGWEAESMDISVEFWVTVSPKKLISKFELEAQGRAYSFEPIEVAESGKRIAVNIVQRI